MEPTWNIDSLKVYLEALIHANTERIGAVIEANDKRNRDRYEENHYFVKAQAEWSQEALKAALAASERAILKVETNTNARFDSVNEFRGTLSDQQRLLIPRSEAEFRINSLEQQIRAIASRQDIQEGGKRGSHEGWGWAAAVVGLIIAVVTIAARFLPH